MKYIYFLISAFLCGLSFEAGKAGVDRYIIAAYEEGRLSVILETVERDGKIELLESE